MRKMSVVTEEGKYASDDGWVMRREAGKTPNGNEMDGRWVLRDPVGNFVDFDQYRKDLAERNNLDLYWITS